ncbi:YfhO family protein [Puia dinghuensis]|uniref:Membrane protein n=1 Tax=Puia dinghuensis TaxID=1792502 RepID=A0A8J2U827_9BACT|nr:YfhO family protein [Puia dinghuensis]GGA85731.1 membrane protein [Puia dinghuensis]
MNSSILKKALPHLIAIVVFLVVAVVYCRPALEGKVVYQSDMLQWKGMAQQSMEYKAKYGHYPLWSESAFSGMPAYTIAMEGRSKFSFEYLSYILTLGLPQPINFFFLACICFYILLAVLRVNPWVGILASLAYAYSSYDPVIIATGHVTKMWALAYAPGVVAGLLLLFRRQYLSGTALLTLFLAFQMGTQHLQVVYYTLLSMGLLTLFYAVDSIRKGQVKQLMLSLGLALAAGLIAFGTSTVGTLPVQEYSKETMRGGRTELTSGTSKLESRNGLSKDYAFQWSYGIGETLTLAVPDIYGGGSGGKEIGDNSKFADQLAQEFSVPEEQGLQYANGSAYWGAQPFTSGPVYLGAVICFLFIFGLVYVKGWQKWWLLSVVVVGILLSWGKNFSSLNYFLFDHFPYYNKFRAPAMALVMPQLAVPLLAALGLNELLTRGDSREVLWKKFKTAAIATGALLAVLVLFYFSADYKGAHDGDLKERFVQGKMQQLSQGRQAGSDAQQQAIATGNSLIKALQADRQSIYGSDLLRTILLIAAAALLLGLFIRNKIKNPVILVAGLIVLSTYDLLAVSTRYLNQDSYTDEADFEASMSPTPADQQISSDPDQNFRVFDQSSQSPFEDARASYFHNSLGGYSPAKLGLYQDLIENQLSKGNMQVYNMLNTKYFIGRDQRTGQPVAQRNPAAFGPCWLVKAIHYVKDGNEEMKALDSINVRDTAIIQQQFESLVKAPPVPDSTASIRLKENLNDKLTYQFSGKTNQFAVFSEIYYDKGWNAFIDGNKADYCRVDYVLRGMAIPAGEHTIEFRFEPHSYAVASTLSVWSSLLVYGLLITAAVGEWKRRSQPAKKAA